jgi:Bacteriophage T4, Gp8.
MPLLLRSQGRQEIARSVYRDIYNENDYYYFFVSRTQEWADEEDPEQPIDSVSYSNTSHRNMLFVKRIQANDAVLMAPRHNWALGTVYDQYDDAYGETDANDDLITPYSAGSTTLNTAVFYVVTDEYNVYKCISNGGDSESTVKPTGTDTNTFETSDGYIWKFMFRVEAGDVTKFLTTTHIPVRKMAGLGEPQFDVNGFIDNISVTSGGSGYSTAPYVVIQGDGKTAPTVSIDSTTGQDAAAFSICSTAGDPPVDIVSSIIVTNGGSGYRSQVSKTFNGSSSAAVSVSNNTISITSHGFTDLDLVTYSNGGGTSIGGLTNDRPYYVIYIGANTIKLATSYENADNAVAIDLTSLGTGSSHTLTFEGTTVSLLGGAGSGATATPVISSGVITGITVTDGGTGYAGARATAVLGEGASASEVDSVTINEPGSGFSFANVSFIPVPGTITATVATSGTGGQFTCGNSTLTVGSHILITGTRAGTGTITGYTSGTTYKVSAVTGTSPNVTGFTLQTSAGAAIVTTAGTLTGLTYTKVINETATASAVLGFTEGGTPQENVEAAATPGTIDRIVILSGGNSYISGDASISIIGDGQDAEATLTLNDGVVTDVTITNPGSGYSFAEISVVNAAEGSPGNGATFRAVVSPYGGHGSNPQKELFAKSLSLTVSLANETSDTFLNNDFRQLGIIKNPRIFGSSDNFTSNTGNCCYVIAINSPELVDYDDVITSDDGGRFIVVQKEDSNNNGVVDRIHLLPIIPKISGTSILTNLTQELSLGSPVADTFNIGTVVSPILVAVLEPEVDNRTGEIIYLDNRIKIIRTSDQVEKIRALINF